MKSTCDVTTWHGTRVHTSGSWRGTLVLASTFRWRLRHVALRCPSLHFFSRAFFGILIPIKRIQNKASLIALAPPRHHLQSPPHQITSLTIMRFALIIAALAAVAMAAPLPQRTLPVSTGASLLDHY